MFMTLFEFRFNIALLHTISLYHCKSVREEKPSRVLPLPRVLPAATTVTGQDSNVEKQTLWDT